jgi:predicted amidohydrolase
MSTLRVACVQLCSSADVRENVATTLALMGQAHERGAECIATPEMTSFIDKRPRALEKNARSEETDEALASFRDFSKRKKVWLLIGSLPIRIAKHKYVNRSFLISPEGAITARYDKIHLFDAPVATEESYTESSSYEGGTVAVVAKLGDARIGLSICYDVRFPHLYRALAREGADIWTIPSAFTQKTGAAHWHILVRARAIENGCFVLAPAQGGLHADGRATYGHSLIVNPWGEVIAEGGVEPGVISATIDIEEVARARARIPSLTTNSDFTFSLHD